MGHVAFRTKSAVVLTHMVEYLTQNGVSGTWIENEYGHGPAFRIASPDGHKGQAWGLQTVSSLHTYGTPPV
jgi:catechol 2,3-dioxygenase